MKSPILGVTSADSPTESLAAFVTDVAGADLPADVAAKTTDILIDSIASALVGRHGDETAQVAAAARAFGGEGASTVVAGKPLSLAGAVLLNGYQVTAVTICDMHIAALNHVTPGVIAPSLALAEQRHRSGADLLRAVVAGLETAVRLGLAINFPAFREKGWHAPGVIGPFGAAAASSILLDLDRQQTINAMGLAGSQSAGTYAAWGTPTVKFHQTRGGVSGTLAALLAAEGFRSSQDFLNHPDGGLFSTYTRDADPSILVDGLGEKWRFGEINLRRWPAATQFQSIIEAILDLIDRDRPVFRDIEQVNLRLPTEVFDYFGGFGWEDRFNARLSPRYVTAVVLADGRCWVEQFNDERLQDDALLAFARDRVNVSADPDISGVGAEIEVKVGGQTLTAACPVPKGDGTRPLDRAEIIAKFHDAREGIIDDTAAITVLDALTNLADVDDVAPIVALLGAT